MKIPEPVFLGYFPKRTMGRNAWFGNAPVEEVGSVSHCMSPGPEGWIEQWKHNAWGLYDSEDLAWEVVRDDAARYEMYAYRLFPVQFEGATRVTVAVPSTAIASLDDYEFLGYDPVSREAGRIEFGHSPLSCNKGFEEYPVNRFCLLEDLEESWRITAEIAQAAKEQGAWEPGPYYLCEVLRKRRDAA